MDQAFRGLALTTLDEGQDIADRISQLYAPPGAWGHGQLWGADVVEIPAASTFAPNAVPVTATHALRGGLGESKGRPAWYSLTLRGVSEVRVVLDLLRSGIDAEVAEASLGATPAGSLIFAADSATAAALAAAGQAAGVVFVPQKGAKPPTTQVDEAPRIAVLVNSAAPAMNDTMWSLQQIFGSDAAFVSTVSGTNSLQNAATDPLLDFDVIYNAGQNYPSATNGTAQARLQAFFARGGGYIGTSQSGNNFAFLSGAGLVTSPLTQTSDDAGGGTARWDNVGLSGPLTSGTRRGTSCTCRPTSRTSRPHRPGRSWTAGTCPTRRRCSWRDCGSTGTRRPPVPRWSSTATRRPRAGTRRSRRTRSRAATPSGSGCGWARRPCGRT
jgi:hypothetical protein